MNFYHNIAQSFNNLIHPYLLQTSLAIISTVLVLYGNELNRIIKTHIKHLPFMARLSIFILVCAFGYGALTILATTLLHELLKQLNPNLLMPAIILPFLAIGFLAEKKKQI